MLEVCLSVLAYPAHGRLEHLFLVTRWSRRSVCSEPIVPVVKGRFGNRVHFDPVRNYHGSDQFLYRYSSVFCFCL